MARTKAEQVFDAAARGGFERLATPIGDVAVAIALSGSARAELLVGAGAIGTFGGLFAPKGTAATAGISRKLWAEIVAGLADWVLRAPPATAPPPVALPGRFKRVGEARDWFARHGIGWAFDHPIDDERDWRFEPTKVRHAVLEGKHLDPHRAALAPARLAGILAAAASRRAEASRRALVPVPPPLQEQAARWQALRDRLAVVAAPIGAVPVGPPTMGPRGSMEVVFPKAAACGGCRYPRRAVIVGPASVVCPGRPDKPCPLHAEALDWALEALRGTFGPGYLEHLGRPRWQMDLEQLPAPRPAYGADPGPTEIGWLVQELGHSWRLEPMVRGPAMWQSLAQGARLDGLDVRDRLLVALVRREYHHQHFLRELVGHPRVIDGAGRTVAVTVQRPTVFFGTEEGSLRGEARLDGAPVPIQALLSSRPILGEGRLTIVDAPPEALRNAEILLKMVPRLPLEAGPALLERAAALLVGLDVEIDPALAGPEVPAEARPTLHLAPSESGVRMSIFVRPIPDGRAFSPGEGPVRVVRSTSSPAHALRDLEAERALAEGVLDDLNLYDPSPWGFETPEDLAELLGRIDALGDRVIVAWEGPPRRVLRKLVARDLSVRVSRAADWLRIGGDAEIDGVMISLELLLAASAAGQKMLLVPGGVLEIEASLGDHLRSLARVAGVDGSELPPLAAGELTTLEAAGVAVEGPPDWLASVTAAREAATLEIAVPDGFSGTLRDYQRDGMAWMARLATWAPGALLCDDMGLGKTPQALTLLLRRAGDGPALVVAPTSVLDNWRREAERFAPSLRVTVHQGDRRAKELAPAAGEVVLTSWDLLVRDGILEGIDWATVVLDEAHAAKNPDAKRAQVARRLKAGFRLALTGTPLENRLSDLWSLAAIAIPGLLGPWEAFRTRFAGPIERDRDDDARRLLVRLLQPFLLRRTKAAVAKDLPAREEIVERLTLAPSERAAYDRERIRALAALESGDLAPQQRRFQALAALTRLRQIVCDPGLVDPSFAGPSTKVARLVEQATELRDEGRRALVFSSFTRLLDRAQAAIVEAGLTVLRLDGSTPASARPGLVAAFQAGEADVFLISLKAGGTGLNLTAADTVFHLDPWWNPAAEAQAADRAHRIGQTRAVTIYKLVADGTVEEAVLAMQAEKRALVAAVLDEGAAAGPVSVDELRALLVFGGEIPPAPRAKALEAAPVAAKAAPVAAKAAPVAAKAAPVAAKAAPVAPGAQPAAPAGAWSAQKFEAWLVASGRKPSSARVYSGSAGAFVGWLGAREGGWRLEDGEALLGEWLAATGRPTSGPTPTGARHALKFLASTA